MKEEIRELSMRNLLFVFMIILFLFNWSVGIILNLDFLIYLSLAFLFGCLIGIILGDGEWQ